jgi:hypothetical protein
MERFFSTVPLGLLAICLGSVMAWGIGKAWAEVKVLIAMTIANGVIARIELLRELSSRKFCHRERSVVF